MLFDYLVKISVMSYGVEIWGWKERENLEKNLVEYYRQVLRLNFNTPRYVIYWKTGLRKLHRESAVKAWKLKN